MKIKLVLTTEVSDSDSIDYICDVLADHCGNNYDYPCFVNLGFDCPLNKSDDCDKVIYKDWRKVIETVQE